MKITVDENMCIGCGACVSQCDKCFKMEGNVAKVITDNCECDNIQDIVNNCPAQAISIAE